MEIEKQLLSVQEAADALSLSRSFVYDLVLTGRLLSIKIGKARRIPVSALTELIKKEVEQQDAPGHEVRAHRP